MVGQTDQNGTPTDAHCLHTTRRSSTTLFVCVLPLVESFCYVVSSPSVIGPLSFYALHLSALLKSRDIVRPTWTRKLWRNRPTSKYLYAYIRRRLQFTAYAFVCHVINFGGINCASVVWRSKLAAILFSRTTGLARFSVLNELCVKKIKHSRFQSKIFFYGIRWLSVPFVVWQITTVVTCYDNTKSIFHLMTPFPISVYPPHGQDNVCSNSR